MDSTAAAQNADRPEAPLAHVADARVLVAVFAALIVLTGITVAVSYFDFGVFNLLVALAVATLKASLVAAWFMHLRYESGLHLFIFLVGVAFLSLCLLLAMLDSVQYHPDIQTWEQRK